MYKTHRTPSPRPRKRDLKETQTNTTLRLSLARYRLPCGTEHALWGVTHVIRVCQWPHEIKRESARRVVPTIQPGGAGWGTAREGGARVWFWDTVGRHGQGSTQLVEELGHPLLQRAAARSPPARTRRAGRTHRAAELLHEEVQRRGAHGEHAAAIAAAPGGRHCGDGPFARRGDQLETRRARGELVRVRVRVRVS